jgi:hypothetical protein
MVAADRSAQEIEVTRPMIEAGHLALLESGYGNFYEPYADPEECVRAVYLAMARAANQQKT